MPSLFLPFFKFCKVSLTPKTWHQARVSSSLPLPPWPPFSRDSASVQVICCGPIWTKDWLGERGLSLLRGMTYLSKKFLRNFIPSLNGNRSSLLGYIWLVSTYSIGTVQTMPWNQSSWFPVWSYCLIQITMLCRKASSWHTLMLDSKLEEVLLSLLLYMNACNA